MIKQYRKKPVVIDAIIWDGENAEEAWKFMDKETSVQPDVNKDGGPYIVVETLEGPIVAAKGDYIIKGVKGEFYPCKPDIFALTYEPV